MQYGHFEDEAREYVITRPDTPLSWSNYLGDTRYGAIITNNAGGCSFYKSGAQGRILRLRFNTIPMDQPGRYFYLRDAETGDFWSASWQPVGKPLETYESICRHGTAYTVITSRYARVDRAPRQEQVRRAGRISGVVRPRRQPDPAPGPRRQHLVQEGPGAGGHERPGLADLALRHYSRKAGRPNMSR